MTDYARMESAEGRTLRNQHKRAKDRRWAMYLFLGTAAAVLASCLALHYLSRPIDGGRGDAKGYREGMNGASKYQAREALK